jgi:hypothetical protein
MRNESARWYHCRACGEEGLTPESERCPHCGISAPVTLCDECQLPIRENDPWGIRIRVNDAPDDDPAALSFHEFCYETGKRKALREFRLPNWQVFLDARDSAEPISSARRALGTFALVACIVIVFELIKTAPPAQPILDSNRWLELSKASETSGRWVSVGDGKSAASLALEMALLTAVVGGFVWLIWKKMRQLPFVQPKRLANDPPALTDDDDLA